jgi:hypothetical protein
MAELKTKQNRASVSAFLKSITDEQRREDAMAVAEMMRAVTRTEPKMWGTSIVGYGSQHYKYASGREGEWFRTGFSPRKDSLTIYITSSFEQYPDLMDKLGKYTTGKACLYVKKLADVDRKVLKQLIARSLKSPLPGAEPHR